MLNYKKIFTIFSIILLSSCSPCLDTSFRLNERMDVLPFSDYYEIGTIFLYNASSNPKLKEFESYEWINKIPANDVRPLCFPEYFDSCIGVSGASLGAIADAIFIEGGIQASKTVGVFISIKEGYSLTIPSFQYKIDRWKKEDPKTYNKFKFDMMQKKGENKGKFVVVRSVDLATMGQFSIFSKQSLDGKLKINAIKRIQLIGGVINDSSITITATKQNPFLVSWTLEEIKL